MKSSVKVSWGLIFSASKTCLIRLTCAMINRSYSDILGTNTTRGNPTCFMDLMSKAFKTAGPWCFLKPLNWRFDQTKEKQPSHVAAVAAKPVQCRVKSHQYLPRLPAREQAGMQRAFNGLLGCNLLIYRLSVIYEYRSVMSHESLQYCQTKPLVLLMQITQTLHTCYYMFIISSWQSS